MVSENIILITDCHNLQIDCKLDYMFMQKRRSKNALYIPVCAVVTAWWVMIYCLFGTVVTRHASSGMRWDKGEVGEKQVQHLVKTAYDTIFLP